MASTEIPGTVLIVLPRADAKTTVVAVVRVIFHVTAKDRQDRFTTEVKLPSDTGAAVRHHMNG